MQYMRVELKARSRMRKLRASLQKSADIKVYAPT